MKIIGVIIAALALAATAGAAVTKNRLDLSQEVFRTNARLSAVFTFERDSLMEQCLDLTPDAALCRDYRDGRVDFLLIVSRGNRVLYNETTKGKDHQWSARVRFRALRDELGPRCVPGRYSWLLKMYDVADRDGYDITRRGTWKLTCENGQLVAKPNG